MINNYLERQIKEIFHFQPTKEQDFVIKMLATFLLSPKSDLLFLLRGYAGTGKTSLVGALVKTLDMLKQKTILLAPTGRAAKVLSSYANHPAFTIHKKIYRQKSFADESARFSICDNLNKHTLFLVDEASMISNEGLSGNMFGSGRLLDDLIQYVYSGEGCRLLLMGDTAQLPPVGEEESPALSVGQLASYGLHVREKTLTQVMRQLSESGILYNATAIRYRLTALQHGVEEDNELVSADIVPSSDVSHVAGADLIDSLESAYSRWGTDDCMIICRSNQRANIYNQGVRNRILYREEELCSGDRIMIVKNNYYWVEKLQRQQATDHGLQTSLNPQSSTLNPHPSPLNPQLPLSFIANGDIAVVRRVRRTRELYGFRFADVLLRFPDYDDYEMETTVLLDTLHSESPSLTKAESERLFQSVMDDYAHITTKRERYQQLRLDPHFNALQIKYAYAVTCHKAQGGQWGCIYLDQGYLPPDASVIDYYRWLYTAFTRATEQIYLVNWPKAKEE